MPRVKRATIALKKRRKLMKAVKGYRGARSRRVNCAQEAFLHAQQYAYRDRRNKKREIRRLWIARINAAARASGGLLDEELQSAAAAGDTEGVNRLMVPRTI